MNENKNMVAKQVLLEDIIVNAVQIPGVKVNRQKFLAEQFAGKYKNIEDIIEKGPSKAGIKREEIELQAKKLILTRTSQSSMASFVAGIPGGLAMAATIPADMLQFFGMAIRLAQEISYLYGGEDLWVNGNIDDEKVKNQLILYCGVMFGVSSAVSGVRVLSVQISKTAAKKIPQKALTKTFWYPIIKKTCNLVGVNLTKKTFANGVSKVVPVVGGVISGGVNFASMMPMANRLNNALNKATFDYSNEEFEQDIEIIMNPELAVENETEDIANKISKKITSQKNKITNLASKLSQKNDPYKELEKLKDLLDKNIITQEEFDAKKKQLLNL